MADKELAKVRGKFVDKASKELISQLLDDILEDGILNDGEKDSILEENNSRADKARRLIDTVKRKGDKASRKMIAYLQDRDPTLHSELGLSSGQSVQTGVDKKKSAVFEQKCLLYPHTDSQTEQNVPGILIPTVETPWEDKYSDKNIYSVTKSSIKSRMALLITNIKFTQARFSRNGAQKDEENMEKLLMSLGYEVMKHTNLTGKEINKAVIEFSKNTKLKETDSVLVVIMSHGKLGAVLGVNCKSMTEYGEEEPDEFPIDNIYKHLSAENCPALLNKPKIIVIQACRGEQGGAVYVSDSANAALLGDDVKQQLPPVSASEMTLEGDALRCVHKEKDFISLLSSTPDTVSYRQPDRGSLLIQYMVEVFNTFACKDDIEELFRKIMQRFEDFSTENRRQMPTKDRCTLTKRFYFFPGR